jgi:hypothetical protein
MDLNNNLKITNIEENTYTDENGTIVIEKVVYVKNEGLKSTQRRYYEKNKEKLNEYIKINRREKYKNDPEYRERLLARKRAAYAKKKEEKLNSENIN